MVEAPLPQSAIHRKKPWEKPTNPFVEKINNISEALRSIVSKLRKKLHESSEDGEQKKEELTDVLDEIIQLQDTDLGDDSSLNDTADAPTEEHDEIILDNETQMDTREEVADVEATEEDPPKVESEYLSAARQAKKETIDYIESEMAIQEYDTVEDALIAYGFDQQANIIDDEIVSKDGEYSRHMTSPELQISLDGPKLDNFKMEARSKGKKHVTVASWSINDALSIVQVIGTDVNPTSVRESKRLVHLLVVKDDYGSERVLDLESINLSDESDQLKKIPSYVTLAEDDFNKIGRKIQAAHTSDDVVTSPIITTTDMLASHLHEKGHSLFFQGREEHMNPDVSKQYSDSVLNGGMSSFTENDLDAFEFEETTASEIGEVLWKKLAKDANPPGKDTDSVLAYLKSVSDRYSRKVREAKQKYF